MMDANLKSVKILFQPVRFTNSTFHNFLWKCIMLYTSYSAIILKVLQLLTNSRQGLKNVKSRNIFNGKLKPDCKEAKGNSQIKGAV